uniref:Cilia- and flagella-associated protein 206 n=1 Tax=Poecilia latipinna TaxID=48699 RepID=A0A3B3UPS7_9TELE
MFRARTERVIKTIICEIVEECVNRGHSVSETLVGFMVKAVVLNPTNGFDVDHTLSEEDVQRLKQLCLDKLTEESSPGLDTIKMQLYFEMNYALRREFLAEIHRILEFKLSGVRREITDNRAKSRDDFHTLYHQIITYILLRSAIGSPANFNCVQDTNAALQSVLPLNDLGAFLVLLKKDKEQQLKELTMIVTGIRIFNEASKQKEELLSLHKLISDRSIKNELSITQGLVWRYTAVLEKLTHPNIQSAQCEMPITQLKQALYNVRQHESFLKILQRMESRQAKLSSVLKQLRQTVQPNTAIPGSTVFPLFKAVTKLWFELQDEAELLHILSNITVGLKPFLVSQAKRFSKAYLDSLLEATEVKTDANRLAASSGMAIDSGFEGSVEQIDPNLLPLEYNGFCGYMFVNRDGLLLPGNPSIGVLEHKERFYAFSSREAALAFASSPDDFVAQVAEKSKFFPELFQLLRLHQHFRNTAFLISGAVSAVVLQREPGQSLWPMHINKREIGIQTDTHPVETHIDKSYEWNEWELRRKAIKLANIRTTVTHSMQTNLSHMRRDNVSQTWLPKEAVSQTMRESGSNVPNPQTYLHGLRGQRDATVLKVDLTRPVEEKP